MTKTNKQINSGFSFFDNKYCLTFAAITDLIIHVTYGYKNSDNMENDIVIKNNKNYAFSIIEGIEDVVLSTNKVKITVNKNTLCAKYFNSQKKILIDEPDNARVLTEEDVYKTVFDEHSRRTIINGADGRKSTVMCYDKIVDRKSFRARLNFNFFEDELIYGLGSHEESYDNLRGKKLELYQHNLKKSVPFFVSTNGYGMLFDTFSFLSFNDTNSDSYIESFPNEIMSYYICFGSCLDEIIAGYRQLTGIVSMLPKWSMGYIQSKERYVDQKELCEVADEYRRRNIPLDALVLDWKSWREGEWGQKSFDETRFPQPKAMIDKLHSQNIKLMMSIWPNMDSSTSDFQEMERANCLLEDYTNYNVFLEKARKIYWKQVSENLFCNGIDGWWCDSNEPWVADWEPGGRDGDFETRNKQEFLKFLDASKVNEFSFLHCKGIYDGQRSCSDKRVLNLTRSCYAGSQRFGTVVWSGDISATWKELDKQIRQMLNFCMSGMPFWTVDIGAFFVKTKKEMWFWAGDYENGNEDLGYRELYTRWFWFGAFLSMFRSHGTDIAREVWRFGVKGDMFYDSLVKAIETRYSLMPYIYSNLAAVTNSNYTITRHLLFDFAYDENVKNISNEFMFGANILVRPVTEPMYYLKNSEPIEKSNKQIEVYLPTGHTWYEYFGKKCYFGGEKYLVDASIDKIPLFIKSGSIIPKMPVKESTTAIFDDILTIEVYVGSDAEFTLYDDEGNNYNYEKGVYVSQCIQWIDCKKVLIINKMNGEFKDFTMPIKYNIIVFDGSNKQTKTVEFSGAKVKVNF